MSSCRNPNPKTTPVLSSLVETVIRARRANWRNAATEQKWRRMFERFVVPAIGHRSVESVTLREIRRIIEPHWSGRGSTGRLLQNFLDDVFRLAVAEGHRPDNPLDEFRPLLPAVKRTVRHHPALPYRQVPRAVAAVQGSDADPVLKLLVMFTILGAFRFGEAAGVLRSEIDRKQRLCTLPPERMKARRVHHVPLSDQALEVVDQARSAGAVGVPPVRDVLGAARPVERSVPLLAPR